MSSDDDEEELREVETLLDRFGSHLGRRREVGAGVGSGGGAVQ